MATRRKKSRHRSRYNHSNRKEKKQIVSKPKKRKKNDFDFFPVLFLVGIIIAGVYFFQNKEAPSPFTPALDQPGKDFTIDEKIEQKKASLKLLQDIQS